jgi:hypothetical protein
VQACGPAGFVDRFRAFRAESDRFVRFGVSGPAGFVDRFRVFRAESNLFVRFVVIEPPRSAVLLIVTGEA